jgi:phenylalanyl-tRNA synthetase beta chain
VPIDAIEISNPLSEERSVLRTSLLPGLAANLVRAQHHQVKRFAAFELGRVFRRSNADELPEEPYRLAILMCGPRRHWFEESEIIDFYDLKGVVEGIVSPLCGELPTTHLDDALADTAPYLHSGRRAVLRLRDEEFGHLGELHPDVVEEWKLTGRPVFASMDVSLLLGIIGRMGLKQGRPLPKFPSVARDIAVVVAEELPAGEVARVLKDAAGGLAEEVALFDIYRGTPVPEGHKSLAFHVVYREPKATLTDTRVDKAHAKVVRAAEERFGASLRTRT